jgi:hypothetical protein
MKKRKCKKLGVFVCSDDVRHLYVKVRAIYESMLSQLTWHSNDFADFAI